jgi:hypothetical protein
MPGQEGHSRWKEANYQARIVVGLVELQLRQAVYSTSPSRIDLVHLSFDLMLGSSYACAPFAKQFGCDDGRNVAELSDKQSQGSVLKITSPLIRGEF